LSLEIILNSFQDELKEKTQKYEDVGKIAKKVIHYSKHSIMALHRGDLDDAKAKIALMDTKLEELKQILNNHPDLSSNLVKVAYQEYTEAHIYHSLVLKGNFPTPEKLMVPSIHFILGLADTIGELRRRSLNCLLDGRLKQAKRWLTFMEEIYRQLIVLEDAYVLAPELRRKCDIGRRVIESTLSDIVLASRRQSLQNTIEHLDKRLARHSI